MSWISITIVCKVLFNYLGLLYILLKDIDNGNDDSGNDHGGSPHDDFFFLINTCIRPKKNNIITTFQMNKSNQSS